MNVAAEMLVPIQLMEMIASVSDILVFLYISGILYVLMHVIHRPTGCSPPYLSELVTPNSNIASCCRLRSASSRRYTNNHPLARLELGKRSFVFAGLAAWKSPPTSLHDINKL